MMASRYDRGRFKAGIRMAGRPRGEAGGVEQLFKFQPDAQCGLLLPCYPGRLAAQSRPGDGDAGSRAWQARRWARTTGTGSRGVCLTVNNK